MNIYVKEFFKRGMMFSGLGPVITAIIFAIVSHIQESFSLTAVQILIAVSSTYILAFVQAGATVFNQIEHWSLPKSLACHLSSLYITYLMCYLVNSWLPFDINAVIIFSIIFVLTFFVIWITVFLCVSFLSRRLNKNLNNFI